jgi:hypothetical protein
MWQLVLALVTFVPKGGGIKGFGLEVFLQETLYIYQPLFFYSDTGYLKNTGDAQDVYEIKAISRLPEDWAVSICVKGICYGPGVAIYDTLEPGEVDSFFLDVLSSQDSTGLPSHVMLWFRSLGDTNLIDTPKVYFAREEDAVDEGHQRQLVDFDLNTLSRGLFLLKNPGGVKGEVFIFTLSGRLLSSFMLGSSLKIDLTGYSSGPYVLMILTDGGIYRFKVLKVE